MLNGEWESSKTIYKMMPDFIPELIGFCRFRARKPATYFYLSAFVDMDVAAAPDPAE